MSTNSTDSEASTFQEDESHNEMAESVHSWTCQFPNFLTLPCELGNSVYSSVFSIGNYSFKIRMFPGGIQKHPDSKDHVGVYLRLCESTCPVEISYRLSIILSGTKACSSNKLTNLFDGHKRFGCRKLISREDLMNKMLEASTSGIEVLCEIYGLDTPESTQKLQIFSNFENFLNHQDFSDVTILVGEKKLYCHKIILSNGSNVFAALAKNDTAENMHGVIEIEDFTYDVILELIRFIYCGKVCGIEKVAVKLLIAADKYRVYQLKILCEEFLCYSLSVENVTELIVLSNSYGAKSLKEKALSFFKSQKAKITKLPGFGETVKKMDANLIAELLEFS